MIGKLKDILGIEGVRLQLNLSPDYNITDKLIEGEIILSSKSDKRIEYLDLSLIEKYQRGRKESKLIDEYILGQKRIELDLSLQKDESKKINFTLSFDPMKSEMDEMQEQNIFKSLFVSLAKKLKNVKSDYRIEASAKVRGTKINAVASEKIVFAE